MLFRILERVARCHNAAKLSRIVTSPDNSAPVAAGLLLIVTSRASLFAAAVSACGWLWTQRAIVNDAVACPNQPETVGSVRR
ncbi:hypothetical protein GCM10027068_36760 [Prescottella soli]